MKLIQSLKAAVFAGRTFRAGRSTWRSERDVMLQSLEAEYQEKKRMALEIVRLREELAGASAVVPAGVWQFFDRGEWHIGSNSHNHRKNTEEAGYPVRDLFAASLPSTVEKQS